MGDLIMKQNEKIKWSRIRTSLSLKDIAGHFKKNLVGESDKGYSEIELGYEYCSATYNERMIRNIISIDYNGNEFEQEVYEFYSVKFTILHLINNKFILSLSSPPKTLKPFIDSLSLGLNYDFGISSIDFDITKFLHDFSTNKKVTLLKVKKIKANSVVLSETAKATIEVTSKDDALHDISLLLNNREFSIDRIKISCLIDEKRSEFEISKTGSFTSPSDSVDLIAEILHSQIVDKI